MGIFVEAVEAAAEDLDVRELEAVVVVVVVVAAVELDVQQLDGA